MAKRKRAAKKGCRMVRMGKVGRRCKCGNKLAKTYRCKRK